ncbi:hypothetical protein ACFOMD_05855 [Sphingoaurantiacus capsulatus]|uniref:DUF2807 domain-containing protein n=1 Tax=Sphingoaurantiacus capsulatus TaxID=1771310 RepID=A0ABV7X9W8_9SPHN
MRSAAFVLAAALLATPVLADEAGESPVAVTRSLSVPLSADGKLVIDETWGELEVVAWDKAEVAVEFDARSSKTYPAEKLAKATEKLQRFGVEAEAVSAGEVRVTGLNPSASLGSPFGGKSGVQTHYKLRVPRGATLVVRHGVGSVDVKGFTGDVDVGGGTGEVNLDLGLGLESAVEASTRVGDIQLPAVLREVGDSKRRVLVGESYSYRPTTAERRVVARLSVGSIELR